MTQNHRRAKGKRLVRLAKGGLIHRQHFYVTAESMTRFAPAFLRHHVMRVTTKRQRLWQEATGHDPARWRLLGYVVYRDDFYEGSDDYIWERWSVADSPAG